jgi:hypothetical protein
MASTIAVRRRRRPTITGERGHNVEGRLAHRHALIGVAKVRVAAPKCRETSSTVTTSTPES